MRALSLETVVDLVEKHDELGTGEALYAVSLDWAPAWVHEAVRQHRARVI